ncbi:hypothetical protein [Amycolatopsis samaneae]|uniref:Uncharacterized protein n=1 Tax=Amycolatopsis samaneae TaxID=664691 RepID=A0ABW5GWM5_9PSEU
MLGDATTSEDMRSTAVFLVSDKARTPGLLPGADTGSSVFTQHRSRSGIPRHCQARGHGWRRWFCRSDATTFLSDNTTDRTVMLPCVFKPSRIATSVFVAAGAALISATPALAQDNNTQQFTEGGIQAANNHNFATCICPVPLTGGQQIAVVPALGNYKTNRPARDTVSIDGSAVDRVVGN